MNLTVFGPALLAAGVAALAIGLFLMQRLRVRHRDVEVVTTLFWRDALEERRARVFVRRFRHPWAYVLLLAIASLLWLLIGGPEMRGGDPTHHVVLLDGSAAMESGERFEAATATASAIAAGLPPQRREVRFVGGVDEVVLARGEALPLLEARMAGRVPVAAPGGFEPVLVDLAVAATPERPLEVYLVGAAPVRAEVLEALPAHLTVRRVTVDGGGANTSVSALGIADAASGAWETVDVLFEIDATPDDVAGAVTVALDGRPVDRPVERDRAGRCVLRDVPARGGVLTLRLLDGGAVALDDEVAIALPDRPLIRVHLDEQAAPLLRLALEVDPAVRLVADRGEAEVSIGFAAEDALHLVDDEADAAFYIVTDDATRAPEALAPSLIDDLAIAQIDADRLAEQAGRPIRLEVESGAARRLRVWASLFGDGYDFAGSRACPVFIARSVRWLAGRPDLVQWAAAGEPLPLDGPLQDRAEAAGGYTTLDGRAVRVALLPRPGPAPEETVFVAPSRGGLDLFGFIGLLLVALLAVEWTLHQRGRMP